MSNKPQIRIPTGGVDRTNLAHATSPEKWWSLLNLRPVNGGLEQTPPFARYVTLANLPIGSGATTDSDVRVLTHFLGSAGEHKLLVGTEIDFRTFPITAVTGVETKLLVVLQTVIPPIGETTETVLNDNAGVTTDTLVDIAGSTTPLLATIGTVSVADVNRQVLLYGTLLNRFHAEGDLLEVEIVTATTAKWRFNSGAWITFTIATSVNIDPALDIYLAFMATDGFNVGDTFSWTVPTGSARAMAETDSTVGVTLYNNDVYITGYSGRILRMRDGIITGVGYVPVFGKHCVIFYNHLVVSQYAAGRWDGSAIVTSADPGVTPWRLAWSHLNDPDQFYPTDLNEADQYDLSTIAAPSTGNRGITGLAQLNDVLLVYTPNSIYSVRYVGLPAVMQVGLLLPNIGSIFNAGVVKTSIGHFFIAIDNIYLLNGSLPQAIGFPVIDLFFDEILTKETNARWDWTYGHHDEERNEVIWTYWVPVGAAFQCKQMVFQVDSNRFYFRQLPKVRTFTIDTFNPHIRGQMIYGETQKLLADWTSTRNTLAQIYPDSVSADQFTLPYAETPDLSYGDLFGIKEHTSVVIDANYSNAAGIQIEHSARNMLSATVNYTVVPKTWTKAVPERLASLPRVSGVVFRFRFTALGGGSYTNTDFTGSFSPVTDFKLYGYADFLYTGKAEQ